jgi:hypothetical protein
MLQLLWLRFVPCPLACVKQTGTVGCMVMLAQVVGQVPTLLAYGETVTLLDIGR